MTDNEIIKALKIHTGRSDAPCKECVFYGQDYCRLKIVEAALDLINRQKAEIEKLRKRVNFVEQANVQLREELKETTEKFNCQQYVYVDLSNIIKEKIAEIEMLQTEKEKLRCVIGDLSNNTEQAKAEAIKECIEKTQEFLSTKCRGVVEDNPNLDEILYGYRVEDVDEFFDNLLKEMVGESNV